MKSLGINFPFTQTNEGGVIGFTEVDTEAIKSNLNAFLTMKRGHRVMHNSLYSPLFDYIMEGWDEVSESALTKELKQKLTEFFPEIDVKRISFVFDEENHFLHLTLIYEILDLKIEDNVSVSLALES